MPARLREGSVLSGSSDETRLAAHGALDQLAAIVEAIRAACIVTDASGTIDDATTPALDLLGVDADSLVGCRLGSLFETSDGRIIDDAVRIAIQERGVTTRLKLSARDARGVLDVRFVALPTAQVLVTLAAATNEDGAERALRDTHELLEHERAKTARLERAHRTRDRFYGVLSHDLRGPLNAILGWTTLLRNNVLPSSTRDQGLEAIERSVRAQLTIIEELLDVGRVATETVRMEVVSVDFGALVGRLVATQGATAAERGLSLSYSARRSEELSVFGDPKRLEQIVNRLLANALKATRKNGDRIEVSVFRDGDFVTLRVADTAGGIAPELLTKVFDCEAYRGDVVSPEAVGLYLVKQLVDLHDGVIEAASEGVGRGATFTVKLRARGAPAIEPAAGHDVERDAVLEGVRVLVVDDDEDARALASTLLRHSGATVLAAPDGTTALAMIRTESPDVLVSVLALPDGEGGRAFMAEARRARPHLPAVAVSAFGAAKQESVAVAAGFCRHLVKPFSARELVEAIEGALGRGRGG